MYQSARGAVCNPAESFVEGKLLEVVILSFTLGTQYKMMEIWISANSKSNASYLGVWSHAFGASDIEITIQNRLFTYCLSYHPYCILLKHGYIRKDVSDCSNTSIKKHLPHILNVRWSFFYSEHRCRCACRHHFNRSNDTEKPNKIAKPYWSNGG